MLTEDDDRTIIIIIGIVVFVCMLRSIQERTKATRKTEDWLIHSHFVDWPIDQLSDWL